MAPNATLIRALRSGTGADTTSSSVNLHTEGRVSRRSFVTLHAVWDAPLRLQGLRQLGSH